MFDGARILITGGTGSLGGAMLRFLLAGEDGVPEHIRIFSRDEAKQYALRTRLQHRPAATEDVAFEPTDGVGFVIGDVRNPASLSGALRGIDVVIHAAAMKQVPTCEMAPAEAVATNVMGAQNLVQEIAQHHRGVSTVVGISTDKACEPVNVMGMTKAIQERTFVRANLEGDTRFVLVRYGNVLESRGSVVPLFRTQAAAGGPLTVTTSTMTRFLLTLEQATRAIVEGVRGARPGEIVVPELPAARIMDVAELIADGAPIDETGIRPGEKIHETLISAEEAPRTRRLGDHLAISPMLPGLASDTAEGHVLDGALRSDDVTMSREELASLLQLAGDPAPE